MDNEINIEPIGIMNFPPGSYVAEKTMKALDSEFGDCIGASGTTNGKLYVRDDKSWLVFNMKTV